ncbi:MAG: hypothetical protein KC731_10985 [Myxococcales bacterium]|nr:hypothetical protein [Myxococcales bacterium]
MAATRDIALELACLRHGLVGRQGRGYDDLPAAERARFGFGEARGHGQREQLATIVQELVVEARAIGGDDLVASLEELARS